MTDVRLLSGHPVICAVLIVMHGDVPPPGCDDIAGIAWGCCSDSSVRRTAVSTSGRLRARFDNVSGSKVAAQLPVPEGIVSQVEDKHNPQS